MPDTTLILCAACGRGWPAPELDAVGRCGGCAAVARLQAAYERAAAVTEAAYQAWAPLTFGSAAEEAAWIVWQAARRVSLAAYADLLSATDAARDGVHSSIIAPLSPVSNSSEVAR